MTRPPAPLAVSAVPPKAGAAHVRARGRTIRRESWGTLDWVANQKLTKTRGMTLGRVVIRAGKSNPPHHHSNCDEVLLLLAGKLRHWIGRRSWILKPGDALVIPRSADHWAQALGRADAVMIVAYNSGRRAFRLAQD